MPKYTALYIVQSDVLDEATIRLGDSVPRRCIVGKLPKPVREKSQVPADEDPPNRESNAGQPASSGEPVIVSRFPSVVIADKKRPLDRCTIYALHLAIGLSSLVIIAVISRLQPGTETRLVWKDYFIVRLVFSCLSDIATTVVKNVYSFLLRNCIRIVRGIYNRIVQGIYICILLGMYDVFYLSSGEMVCNVLEWVKSRAKDLGWGRMWKSSSKEWSDAYKILMFVSEWVFFMLIVVMVGQQLVDYGDCTYFSSQIFTPRPATSCLFSFSVLMAIS